MLHVILGISPGCGPVSVRFVSPQRCSPASPAGSRVHALARRMHIRRRSAVLRDPARPRRFRSAGGGETNRAWHVLVFVASHLRAWRPRPSSLPLPASPLPSPSRRFASRCFVGRIQPPRLAACSAAHATNRASACRSARSVRGRPAPHPPSRSVLLALLCAAPPSTTPLSGRCATRGRRGVASETKPEKHGSWTWHATSDFRRGEWLVTAYCLNVLPCAIPDCRDRASSPDAPVRAVRRSTSPWCLGVTGRWILKVEMFQMQFALAKMKVSC